MEYTFLMEYVLVESVFLGFDYQHTPFLNMK